MRSTVIIPARRSGKTFVMEAMQRRLNQLPLGLLYYPGVRCPACGTTHFHIGRATAECAHCATALVIADRRPTSIDERTN